MPKYNRPEVDLSTRIAIVRQLLPDRPERPWGCVTGLARTYHLSRTTLYTWRDQAKTALEAALTAQPPGPRPKTASLVIDPHFLRWAMLVLALNKGSVRDIRRSLDLLFNAPRSIGNIEQLLQALGTAAETANQQQEVTQPVLGELDEIFQGHRPCQIGLTVVDGRSFLALHLVRTTSRDGTNWGLALLDLEERGVKFHDLTSDGAAGIQVGVREARIVAPLHPDVFHLYREGSRRGRQLERAAYRAMKTAERARRAAADARAPRRRRGRKIQAPPAVGPAEAKEAEAIATYDLYVWLQTELRQGLAPLDASGRVTAVAQARATLTTVIALLQALPHPAATGWARKLAAHQEELLAPLVWLEEQLAPWRAQWDAATEQFLGWVWQHRAALNVDEERDLGPEQARWARAFGEVMTLLHRASSLAESLHSWLRPYFQCHRGIPGWLLPVLEWYWNHHPFTRGKRAGHSPLQLAEADDGLTLRAALEKLLNDAEALLAPATAA